MFSENMFGNNAFNIGQTFESHDIQNRRSTNYSSENISRELSLHIQIGRTLIKLCRLARKLKITSKTTFCYYNICKMSHRRGSENLETV